MKKFVLLFLLINFSTVAYNQVIRGTIMDKNTHSSVNFAAVYFNGTYVATYTDKNGYFELDISKQKLMPITISALGYYSVSLANLSTDESNLIYLTPKLFQLNEIVITANAAKINRNIRRANLDLFKKEFLGETPNSIRCRIKNENDIMLLTSSNNDTLKAFASKPILLDNKALGYKIIYYLDKFEYCKSAMSLVLSGDVLFIQDSTKVGKSKFERRRGKAYPGSVMHFFRTLWEDNLDLSGFTVSAADHKLTYSQLVFQEDSLENGYQVKYISYPGPLPAKLHLDYLPKKARSIMCINKRYVYFDKNGHSDGLGISWDGEIAKHRIADLLPLEYSTK